MVFGLVDQIEIQRPPAGQGRPAQMSKSDFEIEEMAEAAHQVWMEGKLRDGWTYAPITDKAAKQHSCLVPYSELSESDKQSDRDLVRGIPDILAKAGYELKRI
jgi:hypothetical protein